MATQELLLLSKVMVKYVLHVLAELYSGQIQTTYIYVHTGTVFYIPQFFRNVFGIQCPVYQYVY